MVTHADPDELFGNNGFLLGPVHAQEQHLLKRV